MTFLFLQKRASLLSVSCSLISIFAIVYAYIIAPILFKEPPYPTPACWIVVFSSYAFSSWLSQYTPANVSWFAHVPILFAIFFYYVIKIVDNIL